MKTLKHLTMALPLLVLAGCGCTSDDGGGFLSPSRSGPFTIATRVAPIPVEPPPPTPGKKRIDVLFVLDDSGVSPANGGIGAQLGMVYGDIALQPGRKKQTIARQIMQDLANNLKADLAAAYPNETFDLAFGIARYEDFGGSFYAQDAQARPFIVNQPIYRQDRQDFSTVMTPAWTREAPGRGNNPTAAVDAQAIVEALYQVGAGTGFDGNGDGDTTDSGLFGAETTQTSPGTSGDVPAASFAADGNDEDGEPKFTTPGGALASGNLGGVGWRPNALRYVITTSDISGVSPFTTGQAIPANITSTDGGAYPRDAKSVSSNAWKTSSSADPVVQALNRWGQMPAPVAPAGAHTVQASVDALNTGGNAASPLNIEVLSIGTLRTAPIPFKPNQPGATLPDVAAITDPNSPDASPFTWMSSYAILTGARRPWPAVNPTSDLPLVYNMSTVFPANQAAPLNHVREDLVFRVGEGLPTLPAGGAPAVRPPLTPAVYDYSPLVTPSGGSDFTLANVTAIDLDGAGTTMTIQPGQVIRVNVPRYWSDEVAPAAIRIEWLVQIAEKVADNLQKSDSIPFAMTPAAVSADNPAGFAPTPAKVNNAGTVAVNWPPAPPNAVTSVLGLNTSGCTIVRDENNASETTGGTCP
jgi:hypothetical protein